MKNVCLVIIVLVAGALLLSCGKKEESAEVEVVVPDPYELVAEAADSMAAVKAAKAEEEKKLSEMREPALKFKSAEEAVDYMKNSGHWTEYSDGILPALSSQCLKYAQKLLNSTHPYFVIADKGTMQVILYDKYGRQKKAYKMACSRHYGAKHKYRDNRTPEGYFTAEGVFDSSDWKYTDDDGYTSPAKGVYGPRFIRVQPMIGIHGTNAPNSPGLRCSHGCMRLRNDNILDLVKYVQKGMPIIINPSARDQAVNKEEGYDIPMLSLGKMNSTYQASDGEDTKKEETKKEEKPDSAATAETASEQKSSGATPTEEPKDSPKADPAKADPAKPEKPEQPEQPAGPAEG